MRLLVLCFAILLWSRGPCGENNAWRLDGCVFRGFKIARARAFGHLPLRYCFAAKNVISGALWLAFGISEIT